MSDTRTAQKSLSVEAGSAYRASETECWRAVVGYEGLYEVSSIGRVRSVDRTIESSDGKIRYYPGVVLKQKFQHYYLRVGLSRASLTTTWCVHRLVCEAFHGRRPGPRSVVRHLNGEHKDNRAENLRWGTPAENTADMMRHGTNYWLNQTHCIRGHEFTVENTRLVVSADGGRQRNCRACERIRSQPKNERRKAKRLRERPVHTCAICGTAFTSSCRQATYCSAECKRVSRHVSHKKQKVA